MKYFGDVAYTFIKNTNSLVMIAITAAILE